MKIAISTESTCDLPRDLLDKYKLESIAYSIIIGDDIVEDNENVPAQIFEFVEKNYNDNCELLSLAENTGYSYSYLSRYFKNITGISFNTYKNRYRINKACYLMDNFNYSILHCALESGYKSIRSFNRNFKNTLGITPIEYRSKLK